MARILAFDTAGPHVSVAVSDGQILDEAEIEMGRGQGERLVGEIEASLRRADIALNAIDLIAVGIGPGNFTGIRIGVSTARGLALGLGLPALGVSTFEILFDTKSPADLVSVAAPQDQAYVQKFRQGRAEGPPQIIDPLAPPTDLLGNANQRVIGHRAEDMARPFQAKWEEKAPKRIAAHMAKVADARLPGLDAPLPRPAPLYIRPPDAVPRSGRVA